MANEYQLTQLSAEVVLSPGASDAQIGALAAEVVLSPASSDAQITGLFLEVVRSIDDAPASGGRRRQGRMGGF